MILSSWVPRFNGLRPGQRCVIIGNGPSLNRMDLSFLENEITFGLNRIHLLFEKWKFRPTYYVAVNPLVISKALPKFRGLAAPNLSQITANDFLRASRKGCVSSKTRINGVFQQILKTASVKVGPGGHSLPCSWLIIWGSPEVVLIGVDHHSSQKATQTRRSFQKGMTPTISTLTTSAKEFAGISRSGAFGNFLPDGQ